ncbi:MAG: PfkB family carbohydrate kinase [Proteobacteria bacterium]|nr:PfkB family carbohydrate kinase [Pseudomonadota bacterium]
MDSKQGSGIRDQGSKASKQGSGVRGLRGLKDRVQGFEGSSGVRLAPVVNVIDKFAEKKICVIGDIIADVYIFGKPYRLSREAPVVVVKYEGQKIFPGSAGNTINNLLALGARVFPLGLIGNDSLGNKLFEYFLQHKTIDPTGLVRYKGNTTTKTRILAGDTHTSKQQVIRIDRESDTPVPQSAKKSLQKKLEELAPEMDAFIVSDYGHGTVDSNVIQYMKGLAKEKIVVGDSRYSLKNLKGFTMITPNESEAYALANLSESCSIGDVGGKIIEFMDLTALLVTRGNQGMSLFLKTGEVFHIPISGTDDVTDVTGAGDTVCAALTLSLASGTDFYHASCIANYAAGVVVMKRGTSTVSPEELKKAMEHYGTGH